MATIRVLTETELRRSVGFGAEELDAIEAVYPLITSGTGSMPPIMRIDVPENNGEIDIKSAYLPGYSGIAVKVSAGFFDNPAKGLASLGGLMMVLDAETGVPQSALFDNGYLTDLRTGLAGAVAARHLAREDAATVAILGAGVQARVQLQALMLVRPIEHVVVWARRSDSATELASEMSEKLGISIEAATSVEQAVDATDILITTTPTKEPLVAASMLHHGLHVTAVGSDAETKQEITADAVAAADGFFCDSVAQSARLGEMRAPVAAGFEPERAIELGSVISGASPGRTTADEITICDLTGTGAQDTAIASLAVERCERSGLGVAVDT